MTGCAFQLKRGARMKPCGAKPAEADPSAGGEPRCERHFGGEAGPHDAARHAAIRQAYDQADATGRAALEAKFPWLANPAPEAAPAPAEATSEPGAGDTSDGPIGTGGDVSGAQALLLTLGRYGVVSPDLDMEGTIVTLRALERMVGEGWRFIPPDQ